MAIIGIIVGIVGLTISTSSSAKAERCATSVNSLISKCRAESLGRTGNVYLTISLDSNGNVLCTHSNGTTVSTETFPGVGVTVKYTSTTGPVVLNTSGNSLTLSFIRSTGGQKSQSTTEEIYCTSISFTSGRTFTIELVPSTGTHKLV